MDKLYKLNKINLIYDEMQEKYGNKYLKCVYGGGNINNPKLALCFMNPTGRNITTDQSWIGVRYPWLGTKQIWKFLKNCNLFSEDLNQEIQSKKPNE